jgi:hypothetical protein
MLSKKVSVSAAIAIAACVASGLAEAAGAIVQFYRPAGVPAAGLGIFALAAFAVGLGAAIVANTIAPAKPAGWRSRRPWSASRFAPPVIYFALLMLSLALYWSTSSDVSKLFWSIGWETAAQFALALIVWEQRWMWEQLALPHPLGG